MTIVGLLIAYHKATCEPINGGVGLTFAADEAVAQYRIENITTCECRN